jgi:Holliday junction resolvase
MEYVKGALYREADLERKTVNALRKQGLMVYKFSSPNKRGVPDDIVLCAGGKTFFIEFKHPNGKGKLSKLQEIEINKLEKQGYSVYIVDSLESANEVVSMLVGVHKNA